MTSLRDRSDAALAANNTVRPQHVNRMSSIGHPCARRLVLDRIRWREKPPYSVETLRIFESGNVTEAALIRHLTDLGCTITRQQEELQLGRSLFGHPEGKIEYEDYAGPFEVKCLTPHNAAKIKTVEDFPEVSPYYASYAGQGECYMAAMREPRMLWFICPRGDHLSFREFWQEASPVGAAMLVEKSEFVTACVHAGTPPDVQWLDDHCPRCHWLADCWPQVAVAPGEWARLDDPELEALLDRWHELKPAATEFEELDELRKVRLQGKAAAICGKYQITGKMQKGAKRYAIPAEVKEQYLAGQIEYWRSKIEVVEAVAKPETAEAAA